MRHWRFNLYLHFLAGSFLALVGRDCIPLFAVAGRFEKETFTLHLTAPASQVGGEVVLNDNSSCVITSEQPQKFRLSLEYNHYYKLTIASSGISLRAFLSGEHGRRLLRTSCFRDSEINLSVVVNLAPPYQLEIDTCEENASGTYLVQINEWRAVAPQDKYRLAAQMAFFKAEELLSKADGESRRESVRSFEEARRLWSLAGDPASESEALRKIGRLARERGERKLALQYFRSALSLSRKANDRRTVVRVINDIVSLQTEIGEYKDALSQGPTALQAADATKDFAGKAQALSNLGYLYYNLGDLHKALKYQEAALRLWEQLRHREGQVEALLRTGYAQAILGEAEKALAAYQKALSLGRTLKDPKEVALALTAIGHLYSSTGRKQEALDNYHQAMTLAQQLEATEIKAQVCSGLGFVYYVLGESEKSLSYRKQALELYRGMTDRSGECLLNLSVGKVYQQIGENLSAIEHYRRGLSIARALRNSHLESALMTEMGAVYSQLGQKRNALVFFRRSLKLNHASGWKSRDEANVRNHIGHTYSELGKRERALRHYDRALLLSRKVKDRFIESLTLFNMAETLRDSGQLTKALERVKAAVGLAEALRADVASNNLRASYFATVRQYYELYIDILLLLHKQYPARDYQTAAFEISERAHARSLLEDLTEARAGIRQEAPTALLEREIILRQQLNAKTERQMQILSGPHKDSDSAAIAKAIDDVTSEYENLVAQISAVSPHYAALTRPEPGSLKEIQARALDKDTILLEYVLGDNRSYLWAVTQTSISAYKLPGRVKIEAAARQFYSTLTAPQLIMGEPFSHYQMRIAEADARFGVEATTLSQMLLGPVSNLLIGKRILIVPDGALQYVPFGVLPLSTTAPVGRNQRQTDPDTKSSDAELSPLVLSHDVVNLPSASILLILRSERSNRALTGNGIAVFADPVFEKEDPRVERSNGKSTVDPPGKSDLTEHSRAMEDVSILSNLGNVTRLMSSGKEAEVIMALAPHETCLQATGFDASRSAVTKRDLSRYRVIHFATHGLVNSTYPELSGIVLSLFDRTGNPQDGFLRMHEIYNLNIPVDLVVLSACDTALGKNVKGEGIIGLTRGFMYAGASGIIASLWKVEDAATAELMKVFYRELLKNGQPPAAALRTAQISLREKKQWHAPYYWAAFVLQGEYSNTIVIRPSTQGIIGDYGLYCGSMVSTGLAILCLIILRCRIGRRFHS